MKYPDEKICAIESNWVEKEMNEILGEMHNPKKKKTRTSSTFVFLLMFFASTVGGINYIMAEPIISNRYSKDSGVSWRCSGCGQHCWSNARDWKGDYYCNACGTRK
jgi:hypothetical protein